jgi:hypothetical protein
MDWKIVDQEIKMCLTPQLFHRLFLWSLQSMALGIPVIASAVGCNDRVVQHGESGFLVNSEKEWIQALEQLLASPDQRRRFGEQGRKRVEQHYSVRANRRRYLTIFEGVYGNYSSKRLSLSLPTAVTTEALASKKLPPSRFHRQGPYESVPHCRLAVNKAAPYKSHRQSNQCRNKRQFRASESIA